MKEIKEGMLFKEVCQIPNIRASSILRYGSNIMRGMKMNGVKIWFPKSFRAPDAELNKKLIGRMRLKQMEGEESQFFLIPDLSFIQEGILLKEIFKRPEFEIKFIKDFDTSLIKGITISNVKIWFPKTYRHIENDLDFASLNEMPLKKDLEIENKYFLRPPRPKLIANEIITEGQTLGDFLEDKDFNYIFNSHHGTISGVKVEGIPIFFPINYRESESILDREALGKMKIKRSTIMELGYFLEQ